MHRQTLLVGSRRHTDRADRRVDPRACWRARSAAGSTRSLMRIVDVMLSIPSSSACYLHWRAVHQSESDQRHHCGLGMPQIPVFARLLRGQMLAQRESDHVLAARIAGRQARSRLCSGICCRTRSRR